MTKLCDCQFAFFLGDRDRCHHFIARLSLFFFGLCALTIRLAADPKLHKFLVFLSMDKRCVFVFLCLDSVVWQFLVKQNNQNESEGGKTLATLNFAEYIFIYNIYIYDNYIDAYIYI